MPYHLPGRQWPEAFHFSTAFPRFAYCSHIPQNPQSGPDGGKLLVAIHGSGRDAMAYRNALIDFSEATGCVILAPLFPTSPYGDGNADGYKYLVEQDIRYDLILLAMVAELETATGLCFDKFGLFGFSGGGHFAHRFLYVHPESLSAVSIGAPGGITPLDPSQLCWTGTADLPEIFGKPFDEEALKSIPIQLVVGSNDSVRFASSTTASLSLIKGRNRIERIGELHDNYLKAGLSVRLDIVPDCGHEAMKIIPTVVGFMNGHFVK